MSLYRAFATVGSLTALSRVLGFVRDTLIAAVLGTGVVAEAFIMAFGLPNMFRRLFAEGAFNSAFVPLFSKALEGEGRDAAKTFAEETFAGLLFVLLLLTALAEVFMPALTYLQAFGYSDTPDKFDLTVLLSRIAFPYLLCMSLMSLYAGALSGIGRFAAASAAQILLNVILTVVMALIYLAGLSQTREAGLWLATGVTVAGVVQLLMLARDCWRNGLPIRVRWPRWTPGVARLMVLGGPALIAGGVTQINLLIGSAIASLEDGARAYLYYADRLYQLPLGIVGVAIGVVLLPDMARQLRAGNGDAVTASQNRSIEFALLLTLPASVALGVVATPIIRVLFERGAFNAEDTLSTAVALAAYAVGLPSFVLARVLSPAYFAREDTTTPMQFALVNLVVNVVGSLVLFFGFKRFGLMPHVGIAIATTIAGWVNAALLWHSLRSRGHLQLDARLCRNLPLVLVASLLMGIVVWLAATWLDPYFARSMGLLIQLPALAVLVGSGLIVFFGAIQIAGVTDLRYLARRLLERRPVRPSEPPPPIDEP